MRPRRRASRTMSKKLLLVIGLVVAVVAVVLLASDDNGFDDGYRVRAIFDNGGFMVQGEEVRVAAATVGEIESVEVTMPGVAVAYETGKPADKPGNATVVKNSEDGRVPPFRQDDTFLIRRR